MEASSATNPIASPFQLFHQKLFTAAEMLRCRGKFPPWEVSKGIWPQVGAWVVLVGQNVGWTNGDVRALLRIIWLKLFKQATGMAAPNWVIILLPSPHYLILHKLNLGNLDPPPSPLSPPPKKVLRVRVSWTVRLHHSTRILPLQAERQFVTLFPAVYPHTTPAPVYLAFVHVIPTVDPVYINATPVYPAFISVTGCILPRTVFTVRRPPDIGPVYRLAARLRRFTKRCHPPSSPST